MTHETAQPGLWARAQRTSVEQLHIRLESFIVLIVLSAVMAVLSPFFLSLSNFLNILLATSTIGVLAIAATYVIGSGGLDLSLGSVMGLSGVAGAYVAVNLGAPSPVGLATCILAGAAAGYVNGQLITRAFVPAFIVTLGMLGLARGLALVISDGRVIYGLPAVMVYVGQGRPLGIPMPVIIFVVTAIVAHCVLAYSKFGRHTMALGDSESAARAAGIRVERHRRILYTLSGALAGLAGMLFMARINSGDPTAGLNYELTAITAAIIGGTNLFGGRGSILGTMIGALIMGVLQNGLNLLAVQSYYQQMAIGAVLILAVFIDQYQVRRESRV
ncbi:ABC transporter permease [Sinorhizobium mexicanum]|uniref:ABC transporter permease n=1 Tax=Sinorhizobium mexicanum TaxID=375549 RepID=A0A859QHY8_9HYPH|nr:ABC transporter permease [Sinorhizobium mexicanum]MBP1887496.1 ribose/xylose/arabinose/galactoside ABC-type transport system permease subunit [Sinorhizobium mexicanum]QLL62385.1 ABC transporter permease [Sinorhizobium mexicanum]